MNQLEIVKRKGRKQGKGIERKRRRAKQQNDRKISSIEKKYWF